MDIDFHNMQVRVLLPQQIFINHGSFRGVAQFGSATGLGPVGRRFESCYPDYRSVVSIDKTTVSKAEKKEVQKGSALEAFIFVETFFQEA